MQDAAAERVDDVRELPRQITESAGRRNDRVTFLVQRGELRGEFFILRAHGGARGAKHARERAVDGVGGAVAVRVDGNAEVRPIGPMLPAARIDEVGLGLEITRLGERQFEAPDWPAAPRAWANHAKTRQREGLFWFGPG